MGRRPGRAAARTAAAALKKTPQTYEEVDDEPMPDAPPSEPTSPPEVEEEDDDDEDNAGEDDGSPAQESEPASAAPTPPPQPVVRRKRLGRPPKIKPPGWDIVEEPDKDAENTTPRRRGRGGGFGRGGGRWAKRGGASHVTQQPIDKEGNMMDVVNDEVQLPEDFEGETKVDKMGHLQGGREYRCRTFTVLGRGERLYMLSTEPARCVGFRDSYLFFTKHKRLFKIIIDEDEKRDMIERELIPHSYKGRAIGVVTARSVFREFGAQIVVGGRRVVDDYEVAKLTAEGAAAGEVVDPQDVVKEGEPYNKNQYVAWHGASAVYHSGAPTIPQQTGKATDAKKRRVVVTDINWMLEHAREASNFNSTLTYARKLNVSGIYDAHTNVMQYPLIFQPTHARWEPVSSSEFAATKPKLITTTDRADSTATAAPPSSEDTIFAPVPPVVTRNYFVVDTVYKTPASSHFGVPGPDSEGFDLGANGLASVPAAVAAELPADCRRAFDAALRREQVWKSGWRREVDDKLRRPLKIDKGVMP